MYFTQDIDVAKQYALGLNDLCEYNSESFIYKIEIDENQIIIIDDFGYFDGIGYLDYENMPEVAHNLESEYYCVKNVSELTLIKNYKNEL